MKEVSKSLSERVIARIKSRSQRSLLNNKAIFSALHDEILEAINNGCSLKAIWETLYEENKIDFKYRAFLQHAYQHTDILEKIGGSKKKDTAAVKPLPPKPEKSTPRGATESSEIPAFKIKRKHDLKDFK